jgi:hypothetical protein
MTLFPCIDRLTTAFQSPFPRFLIIVFGATTILLTVPAVAAFLQPRRSH